MIKKISLGDWVSLATWKKALKIYYNAPQEKVFRQFRNGALFFGFGLILIYLANTTLPPSPKQEIIVLAGLLFTAFGFIASMLAYIRLLIGRILIFINKK